VILADTTLTNLDVTALSLAWTKVEPYFADFSIVVPEEYTFCLSTVYGAGSVYKQEFESATAIDEYAHSLPSPPRAARICTDTDLIARTSLCNGRHAFLI